MSETIELEPDPDNPQRVLLVALKNDNFYKFRILLQRSLSANPTGIDHVYGYPENKTLLDIACSSTKKAAYVKCLLENGADANRLNGWHGSAPIHFAVSNSDFDTVKLLAEHENTNIYQPNIAGLTAFHLAAQQGRKDIVKLLQNRQRADVAQDKRKIRKSKAKRRNDLVAEDSYLEQQQIYESFARDESLASLLFQRNYEAFVSKANADNIQEFVDGSDGITYLHCACELGFTEFVQFLLTMNVNPNEAIISTKMTPIAIAAYYGYYSIVQLLLDTGIITYDLIEGENILNNIMDGFNLTILFKGTLNWLIANCPVTVIDGDDRDHAKCLKLILNNVPSRLLNVDLKDRKGNTPLYYAIISDHRDMILSLLERGAYIGVQNEYGEMLIELIQPATLEYFLNEGTTFNSFYRNSDVSFNYNLLTSDKRNSPLNPVYETKPLVALSEIRELRPLLRHPFFLAYLDFKWHIIMRKLFYANLLLYLLFVACLSVYLLVIGYGTCPYTRRLKSQLTIPVWYSIFLLNTVIFLRELTQMIVYTYANAWKYISDLKNWMEIALIAVIYAILFTETAPIQLRAALAAPAFLLSYVELMLLILSYPRFSVHIEMFKAVSLNSFKCLVLYVLLFVAFAFSFHVLFKDTNGEASFTNFPHALFNTLILSTGEYNLTDVLKNDQYGVGHLIVILFIFLIPIVLFNLLSAIAVSDIQGIRKDAELVSTVARAKLTANTEEIICSLVSLLDRLAGYYRSVVRRRSGCRIRSWILELRNYYTNYLGTTGNDPEIRYFALDGYCTIPNYEEGSNRPLIFSILPSTLRSIREKSSAEAAKEEKFNNPTAGVAQEAATLQEICETVRTVKNALQKLEDRFQIMELKLTENTKAQSQLLE